MELNEAVQRIVVGNWRTLLLCLLVAVNVVVARSMFDSTPAYSSVARIQASSTPPGSDTEAESVLNRVKGLATSGRVLTQTMQDAGVTNRDVTVLGTTGVRVSRLGTSAIVDISVVDREPGVVRKLADSLARRVVDVLDSSGNERVKSLMTDLQTAATGLSWSVRQGPPSSGAWSAAPTGPTLKRRSARSTGRSTALTQSCVSWR